MPDSHLSRSVASSTSTIDHRNEASFTSPASTANPSSHSRLSTAQPLRLPHSIRPSKSYSTLADDIRALRESQEYRQSTAIKPAGTGLRRDNKPSPLQQQSSGPSSHPHAKSSLTSPVSLSGREKPKSPRERLEALLASEDTVSLIGATTNGPFSRVASPTLSSNPNSNLVESAGQKHLIRQQSTQGLTQANSSLKNKPSTGSVSSAYSNEEPVMPSARIDVRSLAVRNSSLDSTMSTYSTASQSTHSTLPLDLKADPKSGTSSPTPQSFASLVAATGSAEAAVQSLLKEKESTQAHNAQLWRLVEKQRSMILGLNQDLERALKDKERYRRKVKELTAQLRPTKPPSANRIDSGLDRKRSVDKSLSPAPAEEMQISAIEFPRVPGASPSEPLAVKSPVISTVISVSQEDALRLGSAPSSGSAKAFSSNTTSVQASPVQSISSMSDGVRFGVVSSAQPQSSIPSPASAGLKAVVSASHATIAGFTPLSPPSDLLSPMTPPQARNGLPAVSIIEATPIPDAGGFPSPPPRSSMAYRKNAPKPLNLGLASSPPEVEIVEFDNLGHQHVESLGSPDAEARGRRRTRQADDRARAFQVLQEDEARSVSKKSDSANSGAATKSSVVEEDSSITEQLAAPTTAPFTKVGLPTSPRMPKKLFGLLSPAGSEASNASSSNPARGSFISAPLMSPGLPTSPRPVDRPVNAAAPRFTKSVIATPPLSPRLALGSFVSQALRRSPPSETKTADESGFQSLNDQMAAFPQPWFSRSANSRPSTSSGDGQPTLKIISSPLGSPRADATFVPAILEPIRDEVVDSAPSGNVDDQGQIFKGFVSDQYPALLLPPNALPLIDVRVFSSRMQPSRASILLMKPIDSEDPIFVLGIYGRSDGKQLWRVEKTIQSLPTLHAQIKAHCSHFDGKLPDRSLFTGHAPAKIDARRAALNAYFDLLLDTPLGERAAIAVCDFFSRDVIGPDSGNGNLLGYGLAAETVVPSTSPDQSPMLPAEEFGQVSHSQAENKSSVSLALSEQSSRSKTGKARREGYLTKRGKNFGGWKARYFVIDGFGAELKYYDSPGGPQIGVIKLGSAQIGKQQSQQPTADSASEYSGHGPSATTEAEENQYRHAFLILEPKRKDSSSHLRHVLCAESDVERDAWVAALLQYTETAVNDERSAPQHGRPDQSSTANRRIFEGSSRRDGSIDSGRGRSGVKSGVGGSTRKATASTSRSRDRNTHAASTSRERSVGRSTTDSQVQGYHVEPLPTVPSSANTNAKPSPTRNLSSQSQAGGRHQPSPKSSRKTGSPHRGGLQSIRYNDTIAAEAPVMLTDTLTNSLTSPTMGAFPFTALHGTNGQLGPAQNTFDKTSISGPTNATLISDAAIWGNRTTPAKEKKRSIFAGFRQRSSDEMDKDGRSQVLASLEKKPSSHIIFGIPLIEAVELSQPANVEAYLPAVVYRCLEYLRFMDAKDEEGIFRLSGSSTIIKALRERFNTERDVKLLEGDCYDMHAVASLLKLYLRELPVSILTRELHLDFLKVMEQQDKAQKIATLQALVKKLPRANHELLQALCCFLLEIVNNADKNKMNVRNVGIVFAPTLNIPSPLISQLLTDYAAIFTQTPDEKTSAEIERTLVVPVSQPSISDSIRSPRHQMFSDLPTPMYNQQTFPTAVTGFQPLAFNTMSNQRHTFQPNMDMGLPKPFYAQSAAKRGSNQSLQISEGGQGSLNSSTMSQHPLSVSVANGRADSPSNSSVMSSSTTDGHLASLQPPITNFSGQTGKKGRRESSMIGVGLGALQAQRKPSYQTLRDVSSSRVPEHMFQSNNMVAQEIEESPIDRPMARDLW